MTPELSERGKRSKREAEKLMKTRAQEYGVTLAVLGLTILGIYHTDILLRSVENSSLSLAKTLGIWEYRNIAYIISGSSIGLGVLIYIADKVYQKVIKF